MEASDEDEEYSQFRLKKDQDQANEGSEEENSNPDEDGEEGEEDGDEVNCYWYAKGQTKLKWFFKDNVSSKPDQTNSILLQWDLFLFVFLEEIEGTEKTFRN